MNKSRTGVLVFGKTRSGEFRICNGSWRHIHHHRVGGRVKNYGTWVVLGNNFFHSSM